MFHATIRDASTDALRLSGRVEPYDLQTLREHLLARARRGGGTRVEVRIPSALRAAFLKALGDLERRGVTLVLKS